VVEKIKKVQEGENIVKSPNSARSIVLTATGLGLPAWGKNFKSGKEMINDTRPRRSGGERSRR